MFSTESLIIIGILVSLLGGASYYIYKLVREQEILQTMFVYERQITYQMELYVKEIEEQYFHIKQHPKPDEASDYGKIHSFIRKTVELITVERPVLPGETSVKPETEQSDVSGN